MSLSSSKLRIFLEYYQRSPALGISKKRRRPDLRLTHRCEPRLRHASEATAALRHPEFSFASRLLRPAKRPFSLIQTIQSALYTLQVRSKLTLPLQPSTKIARVICSVSSSDSRFCRWRCSAYLSKIPQWFTKRACIRIPTLILVHSSSCFFYFRFSVESTQKYIRMCFFSFKFLVHLHQHLPTLSLALTMKNITESTHITDFVHALV